MANPGIPGDNRRIIDLPCHKSVAVETIDLGMRELQCECGSTHAVVVDAHPLSRFLPESTVSVLREVIEPNDSFPELGTVHVMGMVLEEYPDSTVTVDTSDNGSVGYSLLWITTFDSRELHERIVSLLLEVMEHAVSHGTADDAMHFNDLRQSFNVEEFVSEYREIREFDSEFDQPV